MNKGLNMDTIYALSTTYGKSGVAVVRISGENVKQVISQMTSLDVVNIIPRHAYFTNLCGIVSRETLDKSLLIYFEAPHSFTGEDVVELHIHGSRAVISSVLKNLSQLENFRLAEPGEFSKRAFYNNKMDLTEAEGLADLIDAETSEQRKFALRQMEGSLKNVYEAWRKDIISILAHLEAYIDFPDEEIPESIKNNILNSVFKLKDEINKHLSKDNIGERLREGFRIVIAGPPNVGKSSLLNALAKRDAAIVSETAGTTRDAIDVHLDIKGYPVIITDTAGLHETGEEIEKKGIKIAQQKMEDADLIIALFDASKDSVHPLENMKKSFKNKTLFIGNKTDKLKESHPKKVNFISANPPSSVIARKASSLTRQSIFISAKTGAGTDELLETIYNHIKDKFSASSGLLITRSRYREALQKVAQSLSSFDLNKEIELSAEDVRLAARELGRITGRIEVNDILDKIFSDFCIGK